MEKVNALLPEKETSKDGIPQMHDAAPPKGRQATIEALIEETLHKAGIYVEIGGCGCCGSAWMEVIKPENLADTYDSIIIDSIPKEVKSV